MIRWCTGLALAVLLTTASRSFAEERLEQETLSIRGNRALPKTLYIAPWKRLGSPLDVGTWESRLDDKLEPVERDLLRKESELHRQGYSVD